MGSRESQQDSCAVRDDQHGWLGVVCDGMSGYRENAAAARAASAAFAGQWPPANESQVPAWMDESLIRAQSAVLDLSARARLTPGVTGTTLLAAACAGEFLHWISAGDTSLFLLRDGLFELLNILHIHERQGSAPRSYLGSPEIREIDRSPSPLRLHPADLIVLASDGLTMAMPQEAIGDLLRKDPAIRPVDLIGHALAEDRPAQDNITVILVRVSG